MRYPSKNILLFNMETSRWNPFKTLCIFIIYTIQLCSCFGEQSLHGFSGSIATCGSVTVVKPDQQFTFDDVISSNGRSALLSIKHRAQTFPNAVRREYDENLKKLLFKSTLPPIQESEEKMKYSRNSGPQKNSPIHASSRSRNASSSSLRKRRSKNFPGVKGEYPFKTKGKAGTGQPFSEFMQNTFGIKKSAKSNGFKPFRKFPASPFLPKFHSDKGRAGQDTKRDMMRGSFRGGNNRSPPHGWPRNFGVRPNPNKFPEGRRGVGSKLPKFAQHLLSQANKNRGVGHADGGNGNMKPSAFEGPRGGRPHDMPRSPGRPRGGGGPAHSPSDILGSLSPENLDQLRKLLNSAGPYANASPTDKRDLARTFSDQQGSRSRTKREISGPFDKYMEKYPNNMESSARKPGLEKCIWTFKKDSRCSKLVVKLRYWIDGVRDCSREYLMLHGTTNREKLCAGTDHFPQNSLDGEQIIVEHFQADSHGLSTTTTSSGKTKFKGVVYCE